MFKVPAKINSIYININIESRLSKILFVEKKFAMPVALCCISIIFLKGFAIFAIIDNLVFEKIGGRGFARYA